MIYGIDKCNRATVFLERPGQNAYEILMDFHELIQGEELRSDDSLSTLPEELEHPSGSEGHDEDDDGWHWRCTVGGIDGADREAEEADEEIDPHDPNTPLWKYLYSHDAHDSKGKAKWSSAKGVAHHVNEAE